jgi:Ser/Thr protein kinase RdoA (MazF antagonist)
MCSPALPRPESILSLPGTDKVGRWQQVTPMPKAPPYPNHHGRPNLERIAAAFNIESPIGPIERLGKGLINDTYRVESGSGPCVLQRINRQVFPNPERIMANLAVLSNHLKGLDGLRVPALISARDGGSFFQDPDGGIWRLMELIPDALSLDGIETPRQADQAGAALGRFHRLTRDLDPARLALTLPGFHRTPDYLARLQAVSDALGPLGLDPEPARLAAQIDARADLAGRLESAQAAGRIPLRVIHGDPKLDNMLFHRVDGRALALVDLDTVQPGLIQHDLGDCLRSCCNRRGESPEGGDRVRFDLDLCTGILTAYAAETRDFLTPGDVSAIYDSIRLMPYELAIRFLMDHLEGDRYFRVDRRGQNLEKARVQLDLLSDIELQEREIRQTIALLFGDEGITGHG